MFHILVIDILMNRFVQFPLLTNSSILFTKILALYFLTSIIRLESEYKKIPFYCKYMQTVFFQGINCIIILSLLSLKNKYKKGTKKKLLVVINKKSFRL